MERLMNNLNLTAEKRFVKFCKKYPELIYKVDQKNIASYVGVMPYSLPRYKTDFQENKMILCKCFLFHPKSKIITLKFYKNSYSEFNSYLYFLP